ncbi:coiled-coil domain-containing protein 157-like [Melanerpes formicivorus]|uniref:coiled-coil domain-containing protein 157-like n=1 Tax=Melanerpes formicivorus TaxID=211600 RepID=UPI00358DDF09
MGLTEAVEAAGDLLGQDGIHGAYRGPPPVRLIPVPPQEQLQQQQKAAEQQRLELEGRAQELQQALGLQEAEGRALKQELKDLQDGQRILEKKGSAALKDLKRQLQLERRRGDRLQERLQELLTPTRSRGGLEELGLEGGSPGRGPGGDSSSLSSLGRDGSAPGSTKSGSGSPGGGQRGRGSRPGGGCPRRKLLNCSSAWHRASRRGGCWRRRFATWSWAPPPWPRICAARLPSSRASSETAAAKPRAPPTPRPSAGLWVPAPARKASGR